MNIIENVKMALKSIRSNKMRSFLTMLGIIIGIASVITIVAAGNGGKQYLLSQFESIGSSTLQVNVNTKEANLNDGVTLKDVQAIRERVSNVYAVSEVNQAYGELNAKGKSTDIMYYTGNEEIRDIMSVEMISGRFYTQDDYLSARNVIVVDELIAKKFFGSTDIVGIKVDAAVWGVRGEFKIIGVCKSMFGEFVPPGMPSTVYIPDSTFNKILSWEPYINYILIKASEKQYTEEVGNNVISLLESRHDNRGREVYQVQNLMQQVDMINNVLGIFQSFIAAVAAISLLVGGIGVMNIMLVAVTERTREIGIRKSLGAKTGQIMFQFLVESAIITLVGGLIGLAFGMIGSIGIASAVGIQAVFTIDSILLTILFSVSVGLFFGIYPARKAAKLSPIEALRYG